MEASVSEKNKIVDAAILRRNNVMIAKWRPTWIRYLGFSDFFKSSEEHAQK